MRSRLVVPVVRNKTFYSIVEQNDETCKTIFTSYTSNATINTIDLLLTAERDNKWIPEYIQLKMIRNRKNLTLQLHDDLKSRYLVRKGLYYEPQQERNKTRLLVIQ